MMSFALALGIAILITEVLVLVPSAYFWRTANQNAAIEEVRSAWYHASHPAVRLEPDDKQVIGQRLVQDGLLLGGIVFDDAGEPLVAFGQRPQLDLNLARLSGVSVQETDNAHAFDVHLAPQQTGLSNHLVVRLPSEPVNQATVTQLRDFAISLLLLVGLSAFMFAVLAWLMFIRPVRAMNSILGRVVDPQAQDTTSRFRSHRPDELGELGRSLDTLLDAVTGVYLEELSTMRGALDELGFAVLQYDETGQVVSINRETQKLFSAADLDEFRRLPTDCVSPVGSKRSEPRPILEVAAVGKPPQLVALHVTTGLVTALLYSAQLKDSGGENKGNFVAIIAIEGLMRDARKALVEAKRIETRNKSLAAEREELKRLLESCLCLLEVGQRRESAKEATLPDRILNGWYNEAASDGLVSGKLEHGLLPKVLGEPEALRSVFRQSMLLVYTKTEAERPFLKVDAELGENDALQIIVSDVSSQRIGKGETRNKSIDSTLPTAALAGALGQFQGKILSFERTTIGWELKLELHVEVLDKSWLRAKSSAANPGADTAQDTPPEQAA